MSDNPRDNVVGSIDILESHDYDKFVLDPKFNRKLKKTNMNSIKTSFEKYGWNKFQPIRCYFRADGKLVIVDGQHRYFVARELGMHILYFVTPEVTPSLIAKAGSIEWRDHTASEALVALSAGGSPWNTKDNLRHSALFSEDPKAQYVHGFQQKHDLNLGFVYKLLHYAGITEYKLTPRDLKTLRFELILEEANETLLNSVIEEIEAFKKSFPSATAKKKFSEKTSIALVTLLQQVPQFRMETLMEAAEHFPEKFKKVDSKEINHIRMLTAAYNAQASGRSKIMFDRDYEGDNPERFLAPNN